MEKLYDFFSANTILLTGTILLIANRQFTRFI